MLEVNDLKVSFGSRVVFEQINFKLEQGLVCLLGENGVGKSTLFKTLLGLIVPDNGQIIVDQQHLEQLSIAQIAQKIAYMPQSQLPVFHYSVTEMVLMGLTAQLRRFTSPGKKEREKVNNVLALMGLTALANQDFARISGGQQQLVLLARAIVQDSHILIMDEPTANLDFGNQVKVYQQLKELARQGYLVLVSTHDPNQALRFADQVLVLHEGHLIADGSAQTVLTGKLLSAVYQAPVAVVSVPEGNQRIAVIQSN